MLIRCFEKIGGPPIDYAAESYTAKSLTPFTHEVIFTLAGKDTLLEVNGADRQATGPLRFHAIEVLSHDDVLWSGDISGSASRSIPVEELPPLADETGFTDDQLRDVLAQRKVQYGKKWDSAKLLATVMKGGAPTNTELGIQLTADEIDADALVQGPDESDDDFAARVAAAEVTP